MTKEDEIKPIEAGDLDVNHKKSVEIE